MVAQSVEASAGACTRIEVLGAFHLVKASLPTSGVDELKSDPWKGSGKDGTLACPYDPQVFVLTNSKLNPRHHVEVRMDRLLPSA